MTQEEEAKENIRKFLDRGRREFEHRLEATMYRIANLPFYKSWKAPQMAEEVLGTGVYWKHDGNPKTLISYYWLTMLKWFYFKFRRWQLWWQKR